MLYVLQVDLQRGVACKTNALHVWIQFHGALRAHNVHITIHDITTWSWVNLVNPDKIWEWPGDEARSSPNSMW